MEKISVVVPVYNTPRNYLQKCVDSLLAQTMDSVEIIIVDDGSENSCATFCEEIMSKSSKVKLIHQSNSGVSVARNIGIKIATGEYLLFVDADDWVQPEYCASLYNFAKKTQAEVVLTNAKICFLDKELNGTYGDSFILDEEKRVELLQTLCGKPSNYQKIVGLDAPWGTLVNRTLLQKNDIVFIEGLKRCEDLIFSIDIYSKSKKIAYYHANMYNYRMSNSSTCRSFSQGISAQTIRIISSYGVCVEKCGYQAEVQKWYPLKMTMFCLTDCMTMNYLHPDNKSPLWKRVKEYRALMNTDETSNIIHQTKIKTVPPKYRICVFLLKAHFYSLVFMLLWVHKAIKNKSKAIQGEHYE